MATKRELKEAAIGSLDEMLKSDPTTRGRRSELRDAIEELKPQIERVLKRGHSMTSLAKSLKEAFAAKGLTASVETIRAYIGDSVGTQRTSKPKVKPATLEAKVTTPAVSKTATKSGMKREPTARNFAELPKADDL